MKTSIVLVGLLLAASVGFAQAEPGIPQPTAAEAQAELVAPTRTISRANARQQVNAFLQAKGMHQGENTRSNGSFFFIAVGYGDIAAPTGHDDYTASRVYAFDKAMLDAKAKMAKYLEQSISTAISYRAAISKNRKPPNVDPVAESMAKMPDDSIVGKSVKLVSVKLDNALKAEGYDIDAERNRAQTDLEAARRKVASLLSSGEFRKNIESSANCAISGLQARHVIETLDGNKGQVAVVAIWSPLLAEMASSMTTGCAVPKKAPKRPIRDQIPSDDVLVGVFGVQQKIDENGNLVLVSFGQAVAEADDQMAIDLAYEEAAESASAQIRAFAGEAIAVQKSVTAAESKNLFSDGSAPDYSSSKKLETFRSAEATKLKMNGLAELHQWEAPHPETGRMIYGVVCTWSPGQAAKARVLKTEIESAAKRGAAGQRTIPSAASFNVAPESAPKGKNSDRYIISNDVGDDDAF